jgi:hypothetical protein
MVQLNLAPNIGLPDEFYAALLQVHEGCDKPESDAINARLILLLANHIGEIDVLREALATAKSPLEGRSGVDR